jgi:hypothetical protein
MKSTSLKTVCACGGSLEFKIGKPTRFEHRLAKITCPSCQSRYMATAYVDKNEPHRIYRLGMEALEISGRLKEMVAEAKASET